MFSAPLMRQAQLVSRWVIYSRLELQLEEIAKQGQIGQIYYSKNLVNLRISSESHQYFHTLTGPSWWEIGPGS